MLLTKEQISNVDIDSRINIGISAGDVVRVHQKIVENNKTRIQVFEGIVIARKHGSEPGATFTVRRVGSDGIAVEKIFPLFSPFIDKIEVIKKTNTRRAKLYFLRDKTPKQVKDKLRRSKFVSESTTSEQERAKAAAEKVEAEAKAEEVKQEEVKEEVKTEEKPAVCPITPEPTDEKKVEGDKEENKETETK